MTATVKPLGTCERSRGESNDWLTPPDLLAQLGTFDLDPCASAGQPWPTAKVMWTDYGLDRRWFGCVWCNPPYGGEAWTWLNRLAQHGNGVGLVFARTESNGFFRAVWDKAHGLYFLRGRLSFCRPRTGKPSTNAAAPSVLVAYGAEAVRRLKALGRVRPGRYVALRS